MTKTAAIPSDIHALFIVQPSLTFVAECAQQNRTEYREPDLQKCGTRLVHRFAGSILARTTDFLDVPHSRALRC